jgi:hypothetical protein
MACSTSRILRLRGKAPVPESLSEKNYGNVSRISEYRIRTSNRLFLLDASFLFRYLLSILDAFKRYTILGYLIRYGCRNCSSYIYLGLLKDFLHQGMVFVFLPEKQESRKC